MSVFVERIKSLDLLLKIWIKSVFEGVYNNIIWWPRDNLDGRWNTHRGGSRTARIRYKIAALCVTICPLEPPVFFLLPSAESNQKA